MKNTNQSVIATGILLSFFGITFALDSQGQENALDDPSSTLEGLVSTQTNSLLPVSSLLGAEQIVNTMNVVVTAYSSTPEQTDDTPFITASGKYVRDGIVATNLLPLGTKIKIPGIYGDRVFVVEDRMHPRKSQHVDIWFPTYTEAKTFGVKYTYIEILKG
jgi:3D (Asp-Asp-Asp) domain-containing protein